MVCVRRVLLRDICKMLLFKGDTGAAGNLVCLPKSLPSSSSASSSSVAAICDGGGTTTTSSSGRGEDSSAGGEYPRIILSFEYRCRVVKLQQAFDNASDIADEERLARCEGCEMSARVCA